MKGCVYARRGPGHFDNYAEVLARLLGLEREDMPLRQLRRIFSFRTIVFLDATFHLLYLPFLLLRSLLGMHNVFIVMRSRFVKSRNFYHRLKGWLFKALRRSTRTYFISIDLRAKDAEMEPYYDLFIDDLQLWDLPYLELTSERPGELEGIARDRPSMLVCGLLDADHHRKCPDELIPFLTGYGGPVQVIVAGRVKNCDVEALDASPSVTVIPRYVRDEELMHLYSVSDAVYAYYSLKVKQPSGVFGRAVQMAKWAVVKKGSYLDRHYCYPRMVSVASLDELNSLPEILQDPIEVAEEDISKYDSSQELKKFVESL